VNPRRSLAIFCLILVLFQSGGYYAAMEFLKTQLSEKTARKIATEKTPLGGQLVFRIPVASGSLTLDEYSPKDSHFTFEGEVYQVIDRHVYEGVLYVVSVRDASATDAQETIESYVQSLAGKSGETKSGFNLLENISKYFCNEPCSWGTASIGWSSPISFSIAKDLYQFHGEKAFFHPPSFETTSI